MLTNRRLSAAEALEWGLVTQLVPDAKLTATARSRAESLADGPTRAHGVVKQLLSDSFGNGPETQMELEARGIAAMAGTDDGREGIAAFLEKRKPDFAGR